jgi:RHS repeat-associated protein
LFSDSNWDYLYVPGSSVPIEQIAASGSSPTSDLLIADANGSVRGLVQLSTGTHQNQLVNYTDYDAYGNPIIQSGGSAETGGLTIPQTSINSNYVATTPFGFGAGYTDSTGLIYLLHRYYDPSTGQFVSIDPLVRQTQQPYEYAGDDPVNQTDPTGDGWVDIGICLTEGLKPAIITSAFGYLIWYGSGVSCYSEPRAAVVVTSILWENFNGGYRQVASSQDFIDGGSGANTWGFSINYAACFGPYGRRYSYHSEGAFLIYQGWEIAAFGVVNSKDAKLNCGS